METRDPNLTKTRITDTERDQLGQDDDLHHHAHVQNPITDTMQETVIGSGFLARNELQDTLDPDLAHRSSVHHNTAPLHESRREELAAAQRRNEISDPLAVKNTETMQETVIGSDHLSNQPMRDDTLLDSHLAADQAESATLRTPQTDAMAVEELQATRTPMADRAEMRLNERDVQAHSHVENGTDTFDSDVMQTEHVNPGDNPAREPDRRDQEGSPFDNNVNEETTGTEVPKSEFIDDHNRYASIDNAQSRVLPTEDKGDDKSYDRYNE